MASEYKLSFTAEDIDERLRKAGDAVLTTPQELTEAQKAQARANIGALGYYTTKRETAEVEYFADIKSAYIFGLYDALMAKYPDKVKKNEITNDDGSFTNYEYVISTGDYSTEGYYAADYEHGEPDVDIKKPKYLVASGMHGHESITTLYLYRFVRDVLDGHNVPNSFREGAIIHIVPVINPWGLDNFSRRNENDVDININFDWNWDNTKEHSGASPASEKETQAVVNWLKSHADADLWIDLHNSALTNEPVSVIGCANEMVCAAKKIALRGIDNIIPYWRDVIEYPKSVETNNGTQDIIYSYSATLEGNGTHYAFAPNVLGISTICLEMATYVGNYDEWADTKPVTAENVAMGAEVLGNVLIEFYNESFANEVVDMKEVNEKLDDLLVQVNSGFHIESGVYTNTAEYATGQTNVKVPCSPGAKVLFFVPEEETRSRLATTTGKPVFLGYVGQNLAKLTYNKADRLEYRAYEAVVKESVFGNGDWKPRDHAAFSDNTGGVDEIGNPYGWVFGAVGFDTGTYNWTAYYWND